MLAPASENALTGVRVFSARGRPFVLAAAGGALGALGFLGFGIWPLELVFLVPLWIALEEARPRRVWRAALLGFVFGWVGYAGGFFWMWHIVDIFLRGNLLLGAVLWLGDSCWFALRFALYAALYAVLRRRGASVVTAAIPPLLVVEWLYPSLFPVYLGESLLKVTALIQISALGGPLLLTALLATVNVALFETWRWWRAQRRRPTLVWACTGLAVALASGYGAVHIRRIDREIAAAPSLRIGIVQGNLGEFEKGVEAMRDHRRYVEQTRQLLAGGDVDLVVWPETVYSRGLRGPLPISGQTIRQGIDVPLLFGADLIGAKRGQRVAYNSALLVGADGVIRSAYKKNMLVPFTEYVPFAGLFGRSAERFANISPFAASTRTPPLRLGQWRISTPICYEAVRPSFVRRMVREAKPHLIVTLANDAWFGDSQEPWVHLEMAEFRAVEHQRYLVRATNSGVSAVVDPAGRLVARTDLLRRQNLRATVRMLHGTTLYTRWGDWPGWLAAAAVLLALKGAWRKSPV